jgi:hypothetical protein
MTTKYWINSDGSSGPGLTVHTNGGQAVATAHTVNDTLVRVIMTMRAYATVQQSTDQQYPSFYAQTWFKYGLWVDKLGGTGTHPAPGSFGDNRFVLTDEVYPLPWIQPQPSGFTPYYMLMFDQPSGQLKSEAQRKGDGVNHPQLLINWQLTDTGQIIDDPLHITDWLVQFGMTFWVRSLWETP